MPNAFKHMIGCFLLLALCGNQALADDPAWAADCPWDAASSVPSCLSGTSFYGEYDFDVYNGCDHQSFVTIEFVLDWEVIDYLYCDLPPGSGCTGEISRSDEGKTLLTFAGITSIWALPIVGEAILSTKPNFGNIQCCDISESCGN